METKFPAHCEVQGPCKKCGRPAIAPIPLHLDATAESLICEWPTKPLPGLSCPNCSEGVPIVPVPCVYWSGNWVGLILDGPRSAIYILRMVLSWIADSPRLEQHSGPVLVRVFCPLEDFAYFLRNDAGCFVTDVRSRVIPHWDHEIVALTQFLDDALRLDEPLLAYGVLAALIESHSEFYLAQELREALELVANASGDEPLEPGSSMTALAHFEHLQSELEEHRPFPELDRFDIRFETPLAVETGKPIEGSYNGVDQKSPEPFAVCEVCCRLLSGVLDLRNLAEEKGRQLSSALRAEAKAAMKLRSFWPSLADSERDALSRAFSKVTGLDLQRAYKL